MGEGGFIIQIMKYMKGMEKWQSNYLNFIFNYIFKYFQRHGYGILRDQSGEIYNGNLILIHKK